MSRVKSDPKRGGRLRPGTPSYPQRPRFLTGSGRAAQDFGVIDLEDAIRAGRGIISTAAHRQLRAQITRAVAAGTLLRPFPGIVMDAGLSNDAKALALAAMRWKPQAVLMGSAAAALTFAPGHPIDPVLHFAGPRPGMVPPRVRFHRLAVPERLRMQTEEGQLTAPSLTVLDLACAGSWAPLCEALRTESTTLAELHDAAALIARRRGAAARAECLTVATGNPWSLPELELQQLYRQAGILGWFGNSRQVIAGRRVIPDITFPALRTIAEVDSWEHHGGRDDFERDRRRHTDFQAEGWRTLQFTARQIRTDPDWVVARTRQTLAIAARS